MSVVEASANHNFSGFRHVFICIYIYYTYTHILLYMRIVVILSMRARASGVKVDSWGWGSTYVHLYRHILETRLEVPIEEYVGPKP